MGEQKEFGMPWDMRVVPLFETLDDLEESANTIRYAIKGREGSGGMPFDRSEEVMWCPLSYNSGRIRLRQYYFA